MFVIGKTETNGVVVVACNGPLDFKNRDIFSEMVTDLPRGRAVLLDLREVNFIDSTGIGELVAVYMRVANGGAPIKFVVSPAGKVQEMLDHTSLSEAFEIFTDEGAALQSFAQAGVAGQPALTCEIHHEP
jgi:anti-sigma B factor antagonist